MGLFKGFKSKEEKELDELLNRIEVNMSNNYKDNAQSNFKSFEAKYAEYLQAGKIKDKARTYYDEKSEEYRVRLVGYTHKDQKPYWT